MTDTFDDLYDQILQCERRVHERKHVLQDAKEKLQNCKDALRKAHREWDRLQTDLLEKIQQRTEVEINSKALEARDQILASQKQTLVEECHKMEDQMVASIREEMESEMSIFCERVEQYSGELDLSITGRQACQRKNEERLKQLQEQERSLLKGIRSFEKHKQAIAQLEGHKFLGQQTLRDLLNNEQDLELCLQQERENLERLDEERQQLSKSPAGQSGDEFKRIQSELASLQTGPQEQECAELQQKLRELHQQLHNRQQQQRQRLILQRQQQQSHERITEDGTKITADVHPIVAVTPNLGGQDFLEKTSLANRHCVTSMPKKVPTSDKQEQTICGDAANEFTDEEEDDMTLPDLLPTHAGSDRQRDSLDDTCTLRQAQGPRPMFKPFVS